MRTRTSITVYGLLLAFLLSIQPGYSAVIQTSVSCTTSQSSETNNRFCELYDGPSEAAAFAETSYIDPQGYQYGAALYVSSYASASRGNVYARGTSMASFLDTLTTVGPTRPGWIELQIFSFQDFAGQGAEFDNAFAYSIAGFRTNGMHPITLGQSFDVMLDARSSTYAHDAFDRVLNGTWSFDVRVYFNLYEADGVTPASTPEPGQMGLFGLSGLLLLRFMKRSKQAS